MSWPCCVGWLFSYLQHPREPGCRAIPCGSRNQKRIFPICRWISPDVWLCMASDSALRSVHSALPTALTAACWSAHSQPCTSWAAPIHAPSQAKLLWLYLQPLLHLNDVPAPGQAHCEDYSLGAFGPGTWEPLGSLQWVGTLRAHLLTAHRPCRAQPAVRVAWNPFRKIQCFHGRVNHTPSA